MRRKIGIMSVNRMCIYHTLLETFNIMKNSSSEQIKVKWCSEYEKNYLLRSTTKQDLNVPEKPLTKCTGITYIGPKLFNKLPDNIKGTTNSNTFKILIKKWIWEKIPAF